jgi:3',5'-cyclic AMP phosphodiesterase CpdA
MAHGTLKRGSATGRALAAAVAVLTALTAGCRSTTPSSQTASGDAFVFVQITDTHLGIGGHRHLTARAVDLINQLPVPIACVVHTGDITADQMDQTNVVPDFTEFARLKVPFHCIPGNHDILDKRFASTLQAYTNRFGSTCSRADYGGVAFLFVDVRPDSQTGVPPGADPLDWLENQLRTTAGKPVLIFQHYPGVDDFYRNKMHTAWNDDARRERWLRLVRSPGVKAVVAGHFHRDELHWLDDVPLYVAQPIAPFWGRQPSFRVYEYRSGRLSYRTVYLEEPR